MASKESRVRLGTAERVPHRVKFPDYDLIQDAINSADAESAIIAYLRKCTDRMATYQEIVAGTGFSLVHVRRVGVDLIESKVVDNLCAFRVSQGGGKRRVRVLRLRADHM